LRRHAMNADATERRIEAFVAKYTPAIAATKA
jgi:hypothetical protein